MGQGLVVLADGEMFPSVGGVSADSVEATNTVVQVGHSRPDTAAGASVPHLWNRSLTRMAGA
ncbi:hypothetical protein AB0D42_28080 [Streptomyces sp. NPDC048304]|uniref:hypothetical protein n=1 Tax=Streptomyces sp. NPDC048304 TaxID=3154820 RepID=UPI0033E35C8C